jgi:3,4-dihydroxy 2-butanone 4-phosphate synthase / GTP cyclohydrolase II
MNFCTVEEAIADLRAGRMLIVVDSEDRENEGDVVMAAEFVTPEAINFLETHARGWICVSLEGHRLDALELPLMVDENTARLGTAFTVTVDARQGTTTGISAREQAHTIRTLVDEATRPADLLRPGHVRPLRAEKGGVLMRAGHTEAAVDLARLAGLQPAGVLCEIKKPDGEMARLPELIEFGQAHEMRILTIADLIAYRRRMETLVHREATCRLPTSFGLFTAHAYETTVDQKPYLALVKGEIDPEEPVLVRVHSGCLTGDILGSEKCDCGPQLHRALQRIQQEGRGVLLYLQGHEGRGIGLTNKIRAYALQDQGLDTVEANQHLGFPADMRDYGIGAQILYDLGVRRMRLMTNNPRKRKALDGFGLSVVETVPLTAGVNQENRRYLETKRDKMGHLLPEDLRSAPGEEPGEPEDPGESEERAA